MIRRGFETTAVLERCFDGAWSYCLMEEKEMGILGIYGENGVGKTTLLTLIKNKFITLSSDFCFVIWVTVPRILTLEKIQECIGNEIGLSGEQWKKKSFDSKAADIFNFLSKKKFILLLDGLLEKFDFVKVGVPSVSSHGSKIAFTADSKSLSQVLGARMIIEVPMLSKQEAFKFFRKKIGEEVIDGDRNLFYLAEIFVDKCHGLPLALDISAHALSRKRHLFEWYHALELINKFVCDFSVFSKFSSTNTDALSVIKFGYDSLFSYVARSCFLYCTLFPDQFKILKDDLIDYWICEELLDEHDSRMQGYNVIDTLLSACLLEEENQYIKMHSFIRDMALQIATMARRQYLVKAGATLTAAPSVENWKGVQRISLMFNSIRNLLQAALCPGLSTLLLNHNPLTAFSGDFFMFMEQLKVLDMSNTSIAELPLGITKLVSLQYLNLSHTSLEQLPYELRMLLKLKYLNLEHNDLRVIPSQVISSLSSLQVLRMLHCGFSLVEDENNILSDSNVHVDELQCLKYLNLLSITIIVLSALESFCRSHKLRSCTKALSLECLWGSRFVNISLLAAMEHLDTLEVYRADHLEEFNIDFMMEEAETGTQDFGSLQDSRMLSKRTFNHLQEVRVGKCLCLQDLTWLSLAPNLAILRVTDCGEFEEIISIRKLGRVQDGAGNLNPFAKLQVLVLESLPKLRSIYWKPLPFPLLNKIKVVCCPVLKKLPLNSSSAKGNGIIILAEEHWCKEIEWEDDSTKTTFLPRFVCISD